MSHNNFYGNYPSNSNLEYVDVEDTLPETTHSVPEVLRPGTLYDDRPLPQPPSDYVHVTNYVDDAPAPATTLAPQKHRGSPIAELRSLASIGGNLIDTTNDDVDHGTRSLRSLRGDRDKGRSRDYLRLLLKEDLDGKKMRRMLNAALDRAEAESRRAQEAEHRAIEIAGRFREELDGRLATERELARVREELHLHKLRLTNAQSEITRASKLLDDVRAERDDAEAAAARAREKARQFREQHLIMVAREEGRRMGYKEGVRIGFEEAAGGYTTHSSGAGRNRRSLEEVSYDSIPSNNPIDMQDAVEERPAVRSPPRAGHGTSMSTGTTLVGNDPQPMAPATGTAGAGAQGSRFRENIMSPAASTLESLVASRPLGPIPPPGETPKHIGRKLPSQARPYPPPPASDVQSDAYSTTVPDRSGRGSRDYFEHSQPVIRDYAFQGKTRSSPNSVADSLPSSTMSQFDLLVDPHRAGRSGALHTIPEVSTSMEMSPAEVNRRGSNLMPDPVTFPVASPRPNAQVEDGNPRYSQPSAVDEWRRSMADQIGRSNATSPGQPPSARPDMTSSMRSKSPSVTATRMYYPSSDATSMLQRPPAQPLYDDSSMGGHRSRSSNEIPIMIQSPSNPTSEYSPVPQNSGMLTPNTSQQVLSQPQPVDSQYGRPPSRSASRSERTHFRTPASVPVNAMPPGFIPVTFTPSAPLSDFPLPERQPSPKPPQTIWTNVHMDPRRTPSPVEGRPPAHARPPRSRADSLGSNNMLRPRTPDGRPPSAAGYQKGTQLEYVDANTPPSGSGQQPYHRNSGRATSIMSMMSPRSSTSRVANGPQRSVSMSGGITPTPSQAAAAHIRRAPSTGSISSAGSGRSGYKPYDSSMYVDPAYYASRDNLAMSPNVRANGKLGGTSPALSYRSLQN